MSSLWKFSGEKGKERGIIALYALHSINKKPKSGYEIIKEIKGKTRGMWVPSKGAMYPTLDQLQGEGLIKVSRVDKRAKKILELTEKGCKTLTDIKEHKHKPREKMLKFRNLFIEILGEEKVDLGDLIFKIRYAVTEIPLEKKPETSRILKKCLSDLGGIK
jgi:DNA-binding PadR family transcriptional regulator